MPILTAEERVGQVVAGRYRLDALLSVGGMGVLFRAFDRDCATDVAVKMLKPAHALEPDRVDRFVREMRLARQITHPSVARALDTFSDSDGIPFLVMELLDGRTLAQELEERRVLPVQDVLAIMLPIMRALDAAHALGVVHRDVKPSNIFLCRDPAGRIAPKLIDFGIAKGARDAFETETGVLLGTPGYMAPEQVQYAECSVATDVWGIGAVLYRCFTGHAPHASDTPVELLRKLVRDPVPALSAPGASRQLCATIDRALARDPHRRYPSMRTFESALEQFVTPRESVETGAERVFPVHGLAPVARTRKLGAVALTLMCCGCALALSAFKLAGAGDAARNQHAREPEADDQLVRAAAPVPHVSLAPEADPVPDERPLHVESASAPAHPKLARGSHTARARGAARTHSVATARSRTTEPDFSVMPVEREATTGLPVATEW